MGELIDDADVEEPEPRRLDDAALGPLRPRRHPGGDERVDEDLEVAPDGVGGDTDLPSVVAALTICPLENAAASRNRWKAGRLRVRASARISSRR